MQALFSNGGARESLGNSSACGIPSGPTCTDGVQNGNETGVDCGGSDCAACPTCSDGIQNGDESGVDCGGSCAACPSNCTTNAVMVSITLDNYPVETSWTIKDASGTTVASGGTYGGEANGSTVDIEACLVDGCYDFTINDSYGDGICCSYGSGSYTVTSDGSTLASGGAFGSSETTNICVGGGPAPTCNDGVQNGNETGVDCGGPDCADCPTCNDGVQNGNETGVDCGGSDCATCPTCNDGVQNGNETGVDCGGPDCADCPTCNDGVQNGNETEIDCGGSDCAACPTCNDGIQNGNETGVDCGGSDCADCNSGCNDNVVTISITLDNYPGETSWTLKNASGTTVASGGTYGGETNGSTVMIEECLSDGCYDFTINDSYGDGICCSYGSGSYTVSGNGSALASGGAFGSSETTNICVGGGSAPTCSDGIMNGNETGIDCGGSCSPCDTGEGDGVIFAHYFESGWDGWQDGGSDCYRYSGSRSYEGNRSIRIRDNSGTASAMTSSTYDISNNTSVTIEFHFYSYSMENGEDFWVRYNDGSGWQTVATYARGTDFSNNSFYSATVTLDGSQFNLSSNAQFRFQCDASGNADHIYIDQVSVTGSGASSRVAEQTITLISTNAAARLTDTDQDITLAPNPASNMISISAQENINAIKILSITGQLVYQVNGINELNKSIDIDNLTSGIYLLRVATEEEVTTMKFVKE